jgi:hypothetical protein
VGRAVVCSAVGLSAIVFSYTWQTYFPLIAFAAVLTQFIQPTYACSRRGVAHCMQIFLFLVAFGTIFLCTWGFFLALGPRHGGLLATAAERELWLSSQRLATARIQNAAAIIGTWTTFAAIFLFYLGQAKNYGFLIGFGAIALFFSYQITNRVTLQIIEQPEFRTRSMDADQAGAVIARLFWSDAAEDRHLAALIKWISLASIVAVIWLGFAGLTNFLRALGYSAPVLLTFLFLVTFSVFWFTTKYGIRGFVFADLVQAPIMIAGFLVICGAAFWLWLANGPPLRADLLYPGKGAEAVLLTVQAIIVSLFLPLVTESHWLRLWAFKEIELEVQRDALAVTVGIPVPLLIAGFLIFLLSDQTDDAAIKYFIEQLTSVSPVLTFIFWIAGAAALFSSAESNVYAALICYRFDTRSGSMTVHGPNPILIALTLAALFCGIYWLVSGEAKVLWRAVPFDRLVFTLVPCALILLPPILDLAHRRRPSRTKLYLAAAGYWIASVYGLVFPNWFYQANLIAAIIPVAIALIGDREKTHEPPQ